MQRRTLLGAAALVPLAACAPRRIGRADTLTVATFNIWHDAGDWPARRPLLVAALAAADADVILLQEVLQDTGKGLPNQAETLATALGGYAVHFTSTTPAGAAKRYGNAVLTRLPVIEVANRRLEPAGDYRTALRVRVRAGGRSVDLVCAHLANQPEARAVRTRQMADLTAWLPQDGTPLVVGGDFNTVLAEASLAPLRARGLQSALAPGAATTTLNPAKGHRAAVIDHLFYDAAALAVEDAAVFGDRPIAGEWPSDHFGVRARLRLR